MQFIPSFFPEHESLLCCDVPPYSVDQAICEAKKTPRLEDDLWKLTKRRHIYSIGVAKPPPLICVATIERCVATLKRLSTSDAPPTSPHRNLRPPTQAVCRNPQTSPQARDISISDQCDTSTSNSGDGEGDSEGDAEISNIEAECWMHSLAWVADIRKPHTQNGLLGCKVGQSLRLRFDPMLQVSPR